MLVAWMAALQGFVLGIFVFGMSKWVSAPIIGLFIGGLLGVGFQAWQHEVEFAQVGMQVGGVVGLVAGPVLVVVLGMLMWMLERRE